MVKSKSKPAAGMGRGTWQTTFMLRNVPNRYSKQELLHDLAPLGFKKNKGIGYIHLPLDPESRANRGYAFVTVKTLEAAERLRSLKGVRLERYPTEKILDVAEANWSQHLNPGLADEFDSDDMHQSDGALLPRFDYQIFDQAQENPGRNLNDFIDKRFFSNPRLSISTGSTRSQHIDGSKHRGLSPDYSQTSKNSTTGCSSFHSEDEADSPSTRDNNVENMEDGGEHDTQIEQRDGDHDTMGAAPEQDLVTTFMIRNIRNRNHLNGSY